MTEQERRERQRAYARAHYLRNREAYNERARAWAAAHPERRAEIRRASERRCATRPNTPAKTETRRRWKQNHPERRRADRARRRAALREAFVEPVIPLVVLELHDGVCGICGHDVDPFAFDVDHVVPLARGGFHNYANTQPAHPVCNRRKGTTDG